MPRTRPATLMLVDWYLRILHLDRRLPLNFDLVLHVHLHARSVFFMWVTVVILVIVGIVVLASRKRELIQRWTLLRAACRFVAKSLRNSCVG